MADIENELEQAAALWVQNSKNFDHEKARMKHSLEWIDEYLARKHHEA